jgi:polyphosphate kinase 2 (PPK2 family)
VVLKYFLHITPEEQEERLLDREKDPKAAWKINPKDWEERKYWDAYTEAYEEAIARTSAPHAPWTVVPANKKWYRNLVVAESIVAALRPLRKEWMAKLDEMAKSWRSA